MIDFINNQDKRLIDDLRNQIRKDTKIKIAAACFSMYAFDALKEELKNIKELEFVFSFPAFDKVIAEDMPKERRQFTVLNCDNENSLYGTEFEVRLKNKLTQKAIARECAEWIKDKVVFKSNKSTTAIPQFINVDNGDKKIMYSPIDGFTTVTLGTAKDDSLFTMINKNDDKEASRYVLDKFDTLWQDKSKLNNVTDTVVEYLSSAYKDNSPEFIYFVILYNIFTEFLADINADYIPNEATGFRNSKIWNKLYNFQKDGAIGIINKLEKYNGCILADSVGLGKTFTALAVMKYYDLRNRNILVLCPKRLAENWNNYKGNVKTNPFIEDKLNFEVLYHTDLGRKKGYSNGINLAKIYWENYDLIVIDESHNFRNAEEYRGRETRYNFLMNKVMKPGVKTKVLMLTATPVNNRYYDLKNQLMLAYAGDVQEFNRKVGTSKSIDYIFGQAQKAFNRWSKLPTEQRKTQDLLDSLDIDFSMLLDSVTIARSRKHIQKYYDTKDIGEFPTRKEPISLKCNITERKDIMPLKDVYKTLTSLTMGVYAPFSYILDSKVEHYEKLYDIQTESGGTLKRSGREKSIQRLMTVNILKRLESCIGAFRITVEHVIESNRVILNKIVSYRTTGTPKYLEENLADYKDLEDEDMENIEPEECRISFEDIDLISWERDIQHDINALQMLYYEISRIHVEDDAKLQALKKLIEEKLKNPINEGNRKLLIFSAFADTANYLYDNLSNDLKLLYNLESANVQGAGSNKTTIAGAADIDRILTLFSPISKDKEMIMSHEKSVIDVLIATDCISEGQNLQDCDICINYDIHWNPVRIVQRFGRIDRIGSKNKFIQLVNFWPNITLDEYIKLNSRVESRMAIVDATSTADDNLLTKEQQELEYRKVQLKKLQDGKLQDLEDVEGGLPPVLSPT